MKKTYSNFSVTLIGKPCTKGNRIPKLTIFNPVERPKTTAINMMTNKTLKPDTERIKLENKDITDVWLLIKFCTKYTPTNINNVWRLIPLIAVLK